MNTIPSMTSIDSIQKSAIDPYLIKTSYEGPAFLLGIGAVVLVVVYLYSKKKKHGKH